MPHVCRIVRQNYTRTVGDTGSRADHFQVYDDVDCWVQNAKNTEVIEWQKRDVIVSHRCSFQTELDLELGDEIEIINGPGFAGKRLLTKSSPVERTAGFGLAWTVYCEIEE